MERTVIELTLALVLAVSALAAFVFYRSRKHDSKLSEFYKAVDRMRDHAHTASSMAEIRELHDEIDVVRESFEGDVSKVVLEKELSLITSLLNKKLKKVK